MFQKYKKSYTKEGVLFFACLSKIIQGSPNNFFFGKCFKTKLLEYFLKFLFLFESTILPVNNGK